MSSRPLHLDADQCRVRQQRLCSRLADLNAERAVFVSHENVQYFTGFRPHRLMHAIVCIDADGQSTLVAPNSEPELAAADRVVTYEAQWHATLRQEQLETACDLLSHTVGSRSSQLGVCFSEHSQHVTRTLFASDQPGSRLIDLDPAVRALRRRKDSDELAMIRRAIDCTAAMYARARDVIRPGISELQVFGELHAAAVDMAQEPLTALGNDFQCCSPGGPPRPRAAQDGELYILDLGPCYRGYYADNCRTIAVSGQPTDRQHQAWEAIVDVLNMVEKTVRPGVSCRAVFEEARQRLDAFHPDAFSHHLGHGFGLYPHTAPHLNPHWNDQFEAGDTFTAEPGLYTDDLRAGIRLEQNYLVTDNGVELLTTFPLDMQST